MLLSYVHFERLHFQRVNCKNEKTNLLAINIPVEIEVLILLFKKTDLVIVLHLLEVWMWKAQVPYPFFKVYYFKMS